ncbi:hypothetical protein V5O48_017213 [Marasmius crinis-equi]|uniref:Inositol-pentakisphosphate 2-kinase n=1 Tax=Marasmius crinis-equi TaxID=585013 RepID=A0ABR3EPT9_9AGAR
MSSDITLTNPLKDWKYVSEGGATIVFSYIGPPNPAYDGMVLRLRKSPNVPVGVRDSDSSDTDEEDDEEEEEEDPSISFQRLCMSRLIPPVHLPRLQSVPVRMDPVRSVSIDQSTGVYIDNHHTRTMPGDFYGPPHIHSNRWLRTLAKAHDAERPEPRRKTGGVDVHKQKGVLATDLVGGEGVSVEIKGQVALGYCPLDLFSNDETRVRKALGVLFDAWEESGGKVNNLKIFVKGRMLKVDQKHLLLASSHKNTNTNTNASTNGTTTPTPETETVNEKAIRETFISTLLPLLTRTPALQALNRLQRTLDMLDVEGLAQVWRAYHKHQQPESEPEPELGAGMEEPTIDEWMSFIDSYLEQSQSQSRNHEAGKGEAERNGREHTYAFLPGPLPDTPDVKYTEQEMRSFLLAYLLSATFKDCSVIVRVPLLDVSSPSSGGAREGEVKEGNVTIIDLDPKSMTRLRRWEVLDGEIVRDYVAFREEGGRKVCVDAGGGGGGEVKG